MLTTFQVGQWVWSTRLHGAAIITGCFTNAGETRESVNVQYADWGYGGRCWGEEGSVYEGYADTFIPIEQGPALIRELLADWEDAIREDVARTFTAICSDVEQEQAIKAVQVIPSQGFHRDENAIEAEGDTERNRVAMLRDALAELVRLHKNWDKGTAYIRVAFMEQNNAAIAAARAALAATE